MRGSVFDAIIKGLGLGDVLDLENRGGGVARGDLRLYMLQIVQLT